MSVDWGGGGTDISSSYEPGDGYMFLFSSIGNKVIVKIVLFDRHI